MESPDKWKRHTVLSSDSGYSTTDSVDKCGWSPQEVSEILIMHGSELPGFNKSERLVPTGSK